MKLNRTNGENSWFVFGVSYPGALSAWFRLKFPHLTCGSLASSAVVEAVFNYTQFDQQVTTILMALLFILILEIGNWSRVYLFLPECRLVSLPVQSVKLHCKRLIVLLN